MSKYSKTGSYIFNSVIWDYSDGEFANDFSWDNCFTSRARKSSFNAMNTQTWVAPPENQETVNIYRCLHFAPYIDI